MTYTRKRVTRLLAVAMGLALLIPLPLGLVDYSRGKELKAPVFSICIARYKDGGTSKHLGLGYILTCHHRIVQDLPADGGEAQYGWHVGSSITFWFGFHREKTWFVPKVEAKQEL